MKSVARDWPGMHDHLILECLPMPAAFRPGPQPSTAIPIPQTSLASLVLDHNDRSNEGGGVRKFEPYSRRELRRRRTSWLRRNIVIVAVVVVGIVVMLSIATALVVTMMAGAFRWYVLGVVHTGLVATGLHLLNSGFLALDREALWHVRGAWGEDNTRSELQRAKRRRLIWGWVDSINLQAGDLDHVVVTRRGGIVAVDSKWRNEVTANDTAAMARAAHKAKARAEGLARTLLTSERGARHRARLQSLTVTPVVVLWGAAQATVPEGGAVIDDVRFVAGRQLVPWLRGLEGETVPKDAALDALDRLKKFRETAWQDA